MADVFISYSRKDASRTLRFGDELTSRGISVWIDQHGIEGAASWSGEIVRAINQCSVFVVMLSPRSVASDNVVREIALAFEKQKKILPVILEPAMIPEAMEYPLAGIQRLAIEDWEGIERVLRKTVDTTQAEQSPIVALPTARDSDGRKTLAVLPFENLSSDPDNEWFADGLTQEIIGRLSALSGVRVSDRRSAMGYKNSRLTARQIATELGVDYLVEGTVRKSGQLVRITSELVHVSKGEHLWSETFKGTFDDIFEIQERVAESIAKGLNIALEPKERTAIQQSGTIDPEAYELFLRAREYTYSTREAESIPLLEKAVELDPSFIGAHALLALGYNRIQQRTTNDPNGLYILKGLEHAIQAMKLDPNNPSANVAMGAILFNRGDPSRSYTHLCKAYDLDPNHHGALSWLGYYHRVLGNLEESAKYYERVLELEPGEPHFMVHLIGLYRAMKDEGRLRALAERWLPYLEMRLSRRHDHEAADVVYIEFLHFLGRRDDVLAALQRIDIDERCPAIDIYNYACLWVQHSEDRALELLKLSLDRGFSQWDTLRKDTDLDPLRSRQEFKDLLAGIPAA